MPSSDHSTGHGRLLTGVAWAVLLLSLWLWGRGITDGSGIGSAPTTGDVAAVGRPLGVPLPPAHDPIKGVKPRSVDIPSIGIKAPVVPRGLDADGAIEPPSFDTPRRSAGTATAPNPVRPGRRCSSAMSTPRPDRPSSTGSARPAQAPRSK